jgi:hypothetical protein
MIDVKRESDMRIVAVLSVMAMLAACSPTKAPEATAPEAAAPAAVAPPVADSWLGQWNGPEGTYLKIEPGPQMRTYNLTIADLDGPKTFAGSAVVEGITFQRGDVTETIHAGNGADTGMKWLADKTDCLVVKSGEGYCR